jgi:hypothetical protein
MKGSAMDRRPDLISSRKFPKAVTGFDRLAEFLGSALGVCGGIAILGVGASVFQPRELTDTSAFETTHCFPTPEETARMAAEIRKPEVLERLRLIGELAVREAELRARLPRSQPGIIIPNEEKETYR